MMRGVHVEAFTVFDMGEVIRGSLLNMQRVFWLVGVRRDHAECGVQTALEAREAADLRRLRSKLFDWADHQIGCPQPHARGARRGLRHGRGNGTLTPHRRFPGNQFRAPPRLSVWLW